MNTNINYATDAPVAVRCEALVPAYESIGELIAKNSHAVLSDLRQIFYPRRLADGSWVTIVSRGKFELHDYNCGFYSIRIKTLADGDFHDGYKYCAHFHVGCLDDGDYVGWSKYFDDKDEAQLLVEKAAAILPDLVSMPPVKELNEMLQPFGIYGEIG